MNTHSGLKFEAKKILYQLITLKQEERAAWFKARKLSREVMNELFKLAININQLEIIRLMTALSDLDITLNNHYALQTAVKRNKLEIANYLASLAPYNPFVIGLATEEKEQRIALLKTLNLEHCITWHRTQASNNLKFSFLNADLLA